MKRTLTALGVLAAGAAALYLADPGHGPRRRAALRRRMAEATREASEILESASHQAMDQFQDLRHESRQAGRQAAHRWHALADEGRHAGHEAWSRAQALAQEGRSRLSARHSTRPPVQEHARTGRLLLPVLAGVAIGAAAIYLLDPQQRGRRWALVRDQAQRLGRSGADLVGVDTHALGERAKDLAARATALLQRSPPDDTVLVQRVHGALQRTLSHPEAIRVTATSGCINLSGAVLAEEMARMFECVASVRGVTEIRDKGLKVHGSADEMQALQGREPLNGAKPSNLQA